MPVTNKKTISSTAAFPSIIKPMLCTLVQEPFTKEGWLYEVKWDGDRIVAYKQGKQITLRSRSGLDYTGRYTAVVNAIKKLKGDFILDGEVVAFDENGQVRFDLVQKANPDAPLAYYVFDIVWKDGSNLMQLPLVERKKILQGLISNDGIVRYSDSFPDGLALYAQAQKLQLEGIVAKRAGSTYQQDKRGDDWLKIPTAKRQEFVIGGWAESQKARAFRSLLFGAYNSKGGFEWIGRSGGGFKESEMAGILKKLEAIEIKESPFINKILDTKGAILHFVKPELVANFKFAAWTDTGRIRKPATFLGFRYDKKAKHVVREVPLSTVQEEQIIEQTPGPKKTNPVTASVGSNWRELEKISITSRDEFTVDD